MKPVLVDTDILSMFFRNNPNVVAHFKAYLSQDEKINFSILTYYEILSGLKHKNASKQLDLFWEFVESHTLLPLTEESATISSDLYATLRRSGTTIDDIDILIAGIALSNNLILVTNNSDHFNKIPGLEIANWFTDPVISA
ncbi:MAG: type II toxin-antitoxin system VapC family toxin [Candidatus Tectomicrobia bacterium]|uniref:Type II toxin-antitoxin system VapC family toxin n=1 Tax=Tectimicrobiota bacterium TaxID=2528274 RepID=A0A933LR83_UNCTE|nr:type II toxin-antitoxin system VapC family toxin [Candidatus Tectomicrobia bacterium]